MNTIINDYTTIGISGSRRPSAHTRRVLIQTCLTLPDAALVHIGACPNDADGVDGLARNLLIGHHPRTLVHSAVARETIYLVARSARLALSVAEAYGLLIAFPDKPCPGIVQPCKMASAAFCGGGSGTWATAALALGNGADLLVYLPNEIQAPWGLQQCKDEWWRN